MPSQILWSALQTKRTLLGGTALASMANNTRVITSTAIDPTSTKFPTAYLVLKLTAGSAISGDAYVGVWFLKAADGTNYESGGTGANPARPYDYYIPLPAGAGPHYVPVGRDTVEFPACKFHVLLDNQTGQTLDSGSTASEFYAVEVAPEAQ